MTAKAGCAALGHGLSITSLLCQNPTYVIDIHCPSIYRSQLMNMFLKLVLLCEIVIN